MPPWFTARHELEFHERAKSWSFTARQELDNYAEGVR